MRIINIILITSGLLVHKRKENQNNKLPNFRGILEIKHYIPGRLRLNCNFIKQNHNSAKILIDTCTQITGINKVIVNESIGSILVEYDFNILEPVLIMGILLKVLGLESQVKQNPNSLVNKEIINITDSLNRATYEKSNGIIDLKSLVMLLIGGYAMYDIKARPEIRPCGYTCLWWVYSSLIDKF